MNFVIENLRVGDKVRIKENGVEGYLYNIDCIEKRTLELESKEYEIEYVFSVISGTKVYTFLNENDFDLIEKRSAIKDMNIEDIEKAIQVFLEMGKNIKECASMIQQTFEKSPNTLNINRNGLLSEDERVILRNLEDDYKWIVRDETGWLTIHEMYPYINNHHNWVSNGDSNFFDLFNHLFQFIKWGDKPYNIEELLKGECGNE